MKAETDFLTTGIYEKLMGYCGESENYDKERCARWLRNDIENIDREFIYICNHLSLLEDTKNNYAYRMLPFPSGLLSKCIMYVKKAIRKSLKWYIEPICFQQSEFNRSLVASLGTTVSVVSNLNKRVEELEKKNNISCFTVNNLLKETENTGFCLKEDVVVILGDDETLSQVMVEHGFIKYGTVKELQIWARDFEQQELS